MSRKKQIQKKKKKRLEEVNYNVSFLNDEVNYFKTHLSEVNKRFVLEDIKNVRVELVKLKAYINSIHSIINAVIYRNIAVLRCIYS